MAEIGEFSGLISQKVTESHVFKEGTFTIIDGEWGYKSRSRTERSSSLLFNSLEAAESYLATIKAMPHDQNYQTDGTIHRVNDAGWYECVVVETEYGDWN